MGLILQDSSSNLWQITVNDEGVLASNPTSIGTPVSLVLNDPTNATSWTVGVGTTGVLFTNPTSFSGSNPKVYLLLSVTGFSQWNIGVLTGTGVLTTEPVAFNPLPPVTPPFPINPSGNPLVQYGSGAFGQPPIESLSLGYYLNLLTSEYRNSPKLNKFLYAMLKKYDDISVCQAQLDMAFDVDNAVGVQLDAVGAIVGANRTLPFQPVGGYSPILVDSDYRIYVKAKAAQDTWDGTIDSLQTIWQMLFPSGQIIIGDNQNMTATIFLVGTFSSIMKQMIANGLIVPRPQGVRYNYIFGDLPAFGFDLNDAWVAGFDTGNWS